MEDKIKVSGLAIKPGISRNNVMYSKEELRKFSKTLEGVSIVKDHETKVDNAIGKVEKTLFNEKTGEVFYEGWVKNDSTNITEKIKDGRVQHVSIGALCGKVLKESEDSEVLIAEDIQGVELSTVVVPGVPGASISQSYDFTESNIKQMIDDYNKENVKEESVQESQDIKIELNKQGGKNMEKNDEQNVVIQDTRDARIVELESKAKTLETVNAEMTSKLNEYAAKERKTLEASYNSLCVEKSVRALDVSKFDSSVIESLMAQISSIIVKEDVAVDEPKVKDTPQPEQEVKEEPKEEVKEIASPKSETAVTETAQSSASKYVVEQSELGGSCLYKL